jgi:D-glycero-D-manno-heptose 1,7-bisphosphate phosphatase
VAGAERWVVIDRDGVINDDSDDYVRSAADWVPLPGSLEAIAALTAAGFRVAVATNQSGVGRGLFSMANLEEIHRVMTAAVEAAGGRLAGIHVCPHHPDEACACRKPRPGLLRAIERQSGQSLAGVPVIGDKLSDLDAARAVGARPILVRTGKGGATEAALSDRSIEVYADLHAAVAALLAEGDG